MRKVLFVLPFVCSTLLCGCVFGEKEVVLKGLGTQEDPYLISTSEEFGVIGKYTSNENPAVFKLTSDLNIANSRYVDKFYGTLDGDGHKISITTFSPYGKKFEPTPLGDGCFGVFSRAYNPVIKNLVISVDADDEPKTPGGYFSSPVRMELGFIGRCSRGTFDNISIEGSIRYRDSGQTTVHLGALAGTMNATKDNPFYIKNCHNFANITADGKANYAGGFFGVIEDSYSECTEKIKFDSCSNSGTINSTYDLFSTSFAGQFVGATWQNYLEDYEFVGCSANGKALGVRTNIYVGGVK